MAAPVNGAEAGTGETIERSSQPARCLGLFCRLPQPGRVKTRLAAAIGPLAAADLYAAMLRDSVGMAIETADEVILAHTPDSTATRDWFGTLADGRALLWPQPDGDLGTRLAAFFQSRSAQPAEHVVVLGTDSPGLPAEYVSDAWRHLRQVDVVLGPTLDGGYYLLGLSPCETEPERTGSGTAWWESLFRDISWSSDKVLEQTLARIESAGRSWRLLPPWFDIDTGEDLRRLRSHLDLLQSAHRKCPCPQTAAVLRGRPPDA